MTEAFTEILYSVADRVATITLNRPERMNAWSSVMEAETRAAFALAVADENVRAIVLTATGRGFCVGADVSAIAPVLYMRIVVASAIGYVAFAEIVDMPTVFGAAVVTASALYITRYEAKLARGRT